MKIKIFFSTMAKITVFTPYCYLYVYATSPRKAPPSGDAYFEP